MAVCQSLLLVYRSLFASSSKRHWQIYLVTFLKCYCAIAASCKELVNPTIRTTRSTIFDDRREDGKCHLKVETICSFFNLSWYVKSWRSPPLKSSRICLKRSRSSAPSNTIHIALKKFKIKVVIVRSKRFRSNSSQCWLFISSIFYAMNFQHFWEMLEFDLPYPL